MAGIMTVEQLQIEGEKLLGKIRVSPREFVEFQLETEFGFDDLQVLMKTLQCDLGKLTDKVLAYKQGKAKI